MHLKLHTQLMRAVKFATKKVADAHGVDRSTLSRYHRGVRGTMQQKLEQQRNLTLHEELELVNYIDQFCREHHPPTRNMIQHFASVICGFEVSETWVTR
jgi:transcriptional regulator with XRE-family HTH domain